MLKGGGVNCPMCIPASRLARNKILTAADVFGVNLCNGAISNTARWNRKSETQNGGRNYAFTRISAYKHESNEIPTAKTCFWGLTTRR